MSEQAKDWAPNFRGSEYPRAAKKMGPFWQEVWEVLADGEERRAVDLCRDLAPRHGMLSTSGHNVIRHAVKDGLLLSRYSGRRHYLWVRRADR